MKPMDTAEIKKAIQLYFDGCYEGCGEKMAQVFHDAAHVYGHNPDGNLADTPKADFVIRVGSRAADAPAFPREDELISIDFTGENTAAVRLKVRVFNTRYTDILSFMRINGNWVIIAKLFAGIPVE
jgi:hypothetical protein